MGLEHDGTLCSISTVLEVGPGPLSSQDNF